MEINIEQFLLVLFSCPSLSSINNADHLLSEIHDQTTITVTTKVLTSLLVPVQQISVLFNYSIEGIKEQ